MSIFFTTARFTKALALACLATTLVACKTVELNDDPNASLTPSSTSTGSNAVDANAGSGSNTVTPGISGAPLDPLDPFNPQSVLAQERSVYFDFDSYTVPERYRNRVETHARYLVGNPNQHILIEGHTDERGGTEYNLALGQRRADAVRRIMTLFGVAENQIETISFGREKPRATGSSEADWAENRRADIVYQR